MVLVVSVARSAIRRARVRERANFIDSYDFPPRVMKSVATRYPQLADAAIGQVDRGLRDFFHLCNIGGRRMVAMPSQSVDVAWHEFILFTREYQSFCEKAFGRFLHHTPAEAMRSPRVAQSGIKRAWRLACMREGISPRAPGQLPRLFALDAALAIPDGFHYALDCSESLSHDGTVRYCGSHIGCSSGCGGDGGDGGDGGCGGGD